LVDLKPTERKGASALFFLDLFFFVWAAASSTQNAKVRNDIISFVVVLRTFAFSVYFLGSQEKSCRGSQSDHFVSSAT